MKVLPRKVQVSEAGEALTLSVPPAGPELRPPEPRRSEAQDRQALAARGQGFESPLLKEVLESRVGPCLLRFAEGQGPTPAELSGLRWALSGLQRAQYKALEKALVAAVGGQAKQARSLSARPKNKEADLARVLWILGGGLTAPVPPDFPPGHPLHGAIDWDRQSFNRLLSKGELPTADDVRALAFSMDFKMSKGTVGKGGTEAERQRVLAAHHQLRAEVTQLMAEVEVHDQSAEAQLARARRAALVKGEYSAVDLRRDLEALGSVESDAFVLRLFGIKTRPGMSLPGEAEVVVYSPSPSFIGKALADALPVGSVLCDCGSGLGAVCLLYSFLSGSPSIGVERDPALADRAKGAASEAGLSQVRFLEQDIRKTDFSAADAFYFFNPFTGSIMAEVLQQLEALARTKPIHIAGLNSAFDHVPWLEKVPNRTMSLWRSRPVP